MIGSKVLNMKTFLILLLSINLVSLGPAYAGGNPVVGKSTAIICIGCHARDGNSTNPLYPKLAGQGEKYLAKQLTDFKSGKRKEEHMSSMVEAISKEDIPNIAAYFSQQKRSASPITKNSNDTSVGKAIFMNGIENRNISACNGCHGEKAEGNPAIKFPALAGQHAEYITKSLMAFRSGQRQNDTGKIMRNIAENLSDEEIKSLASYLAALN